MRKFDLTILGCGAAAPTPSFLTTSQLVNIHDHLILIDCGEGCQLTLRKLKLKFQRIKTVLISHMHADHVMGLPGLLASMNLLGRKTAIDIFGPEELESFVKTIWHKTGTHPGLLPACLLFRFLAWMDRSDVHACTTLLAQATVPCSDAM